MIGVPSHAQAGLIVFGQAPRHGIAKGAHAVLLDVITRQIEHSKVHEASDGDVGLLVDLPLAMIQSQLARHGSIGPAVGDPGMGAAQRAAEVA